MKCPIYSAFPRQTGDFNIAPRSRNDEKLQHAEGSQCFTFATRDFVRKTKCSKGMNPLALRANNPLLRKGNKQDESAQTYRSDAFDPGRDQSH